MLERLVKTGTKNGSSFYMIWGSILGAQNGVKVNLKIEQKSSTFENHVFYDRRPQKLQKEVPKQPQNGALFWSWTKYQNHALARTGVHFSTFQPLKNHTSFGPFFHARRKSSLNSGFPSFLIKKRF